MKKKLIKDIERETSETAPGFLHVLNSLCLKSYGKKCIDLLLLDPEKLINIVSNYTNNIMETKTIIKLLFIKPLLSAINEECDLDQWTELFICDPNTFKEEISGLMKNKLDLNTLRTS
ncbi:MAG: hypothetical protein QW101_01260 [Ignisphaera sp.]|uniref:Uncharacterized protein n=1 Tax=Ignisphaera aggregans TaxID=334771 RepID=A0A7J3MWG6_9CREN